jgi:hypothetical protein
MKLAAKAASLSQSNDGAGAMMSQSKVAPTLMGTG